MSGPEPAPFSMTIEQRDDRTVITALGELDLATAEEFEDELMPLVRKGRHVVADLRSLDFIDSSGVRTIVAAHAVATEVGGRFSLTRLAADTPIQRVLEISGLDGMLDIVDDA